MDYMEIMNFCGYDLDKAHEMAKRYGAVPFSESIKENVERDPYREERMTDNGNH